MENTDDAKIRAMVNPLFENLKSRLLPDDLKKIKEAYQFAYQAHIKQKRKSGEPYIIHPIQVAKILSEELELGTDTIIAAFLHDVVEDTECTIDVIKEKFGKDVAFLVGAVTKKKTSKDSNSKQIANYRQILDSVNYDVRALLVKLADRLHNMRTLSSMRADKQMKIAGETDYFYAPLANRLGLYHIKTELENLSFKYRCEKDYTEIEKCIEKSAEDNRQLLDEFIRKIQNALEGAGIPVRTEVRYRKPYSLWRKMKTKGCDFNHLEGIHYIRIIYPISQEYTEKDMSLKIYSVLTNYFKEKPGSIANYIDSPKENGYQSFHVKLINSFGGWEEIHISSERMVRNSQLGCSAERTEDNRWINNFRDALREMARHTGEKEFMEGVTSSFYNDDIMVFTPNGKGIVLPKYSTALDFAYEIHTDLGTEAVCARINGRLASITTTLQRGDRVAIERRKGAELQPEWRNHVMTYKAKKELRDFFASKKQIPFKRCPICHPLPGDEVIGFKSEGGITIHKRNCETAIRIASQQGDSIVAVRFEEDPEFLFPVRISIRGVDRYHLLSDLIECITEKQHLEMYQISTKMVDNIVTSIIDFKVHSVRELEEAVRSIEAIPSIDEVSRVDIE